MKVKPSKFYCPKSVNLSLQPDYNRRSSDFIAGLASEVLSLSLQLRQQLVNVRQVGKCEATVGKCKATVGK